MLTSHEMSNLAHIFVFAPLMIGVGLARGSSPKWIQGVLLGLAVMAVLAHVGRSVMKGGVSWVAWVHFLVTIPLLFIVGYWGEDAKRMWFELLTLAGWAAAGYHATTFLRYRQF